MSIGHPVFWLTLSAVVAPLQAEIPVGLRVPVVVLEVLLGIEVGPHMLDLVHLEGLVKTMFTFSMALTLFLAGLEPDFGQIRGRLLALAVGGWTTSVLLGLVIVALLHVVPKVHAPLMVTLATCTTSLGRS